MAEQAEIEGYSSYQALDHMKEPSNAIIFKITIISVLIVIPVPQASTRIGLLSIPAQNLQLHPPIRRNPRRQSHSLHVRVYDHTI